MSNNEDFDRFQDVYRDLRRPGATELTLNQPILHVFLFLPKRVKWLVCKMLYILLCLVRNISIKPIWWYINKTFFLITTQNSLYITQTNKH